LPRAPVRPGQPDGHGGTHLATPLSPVSMLGRPSAAESPPQPGRQWSRHGRAAPVRCHPRRPAQQRRIVPRPRQQAYATHREALTPPRAVSYCPIPGWSVRREVSHVFVRCTTQLLPAGAGTSVGDVDEGTSCAVTSPPDQCISVSPVARTSHARATVTSHKATDRTSTGRSSRIWWNSGQFDLVPVPRCDAVCTLYRGWFLRS